MRENAAFANTEGGIFERLERAMKRAFLVAVAAAVLAACGGGNDSPEVRKPFDKPPCGDAGQITRAEYEQLHQGMTYDQVVDVVGAKGQALSTSESSDGGSFGRYCWGGRGMGYVTAVFQNDVLESTTINDF